MTVLRLLLLCLALVSCRSGNCGADYRRTTMTGEVGIRGAALGNITIRIFDVISDVSKFSLTAIFSDPPTRVSPLRGNVTSARLLTSQDVQLHAFKAPLNSGGFLPAAADRLSSDAAAAIVSGVKGAGVFLELRTSLSDADSLRIPLQATEVQRLHRSACDWP